jgi:hypothetical protein
MAWLTTHNDISCFIKQFILILDTSSVISMIAYCLKVTNSNYNYWKMAREVIIIGRWKEKMAEAIIIIGKWWEKL